MDNYFTLITTLEEKERGLAEFLYSVGDDIIISNSGAAKAAIHNVGRVLRCLTSRQDGIANFREKGFSAKRELIFKEILKLRKFN